MEGKRTIGTIRLENILSFGPDTLPFRLEPLNVLIGPNASGKSNLIEAFSILAYLSTDIQIPFRVGGGGREWLWKGSKESPTATLEVSVKLSSSRLLRYRLSFGDSVFTQPQLQIRDEVISDVNSSSHSEHPHKYYEYRKGRPVIRSKLGPESGQQLNSNYICETQSILSKWRDAYSIPEFILLASQLERIFFYRDFPLGRNSPARMPQQADLPQHVLEEDASNLAVILSLLQNQPQAREWIQYQMNELYPSIKHIHCRVLGGTVQIFFEEEGLSSNVPATRVSDGSLRYLCLLAALYHPNPPTLICIEEPEMGLHPDAIPKLAKLLVAASQRSQIIVTTHSDILVDALSDTPEAVVICEKVNGATQLHRLDPEELKVWLEKYRLGELWTSGQLGGNLY